ncbi:MAG: phage tail tube protein [Pseudomonadota bacterium]
MSGLNGADVLLLVNTGTVGLPAYTEVGSQRDATRDRTADSIDYSSKGDVHEVVDYGRLKSSFTLDSLYVPDDTAYQALETAYNNRELILVQVERSGVAIEEADAKIDSLSEKFPDQKECTVSVKLTISGGWTTVGS